MGLWPLCLPALLTSNASGLGAQASAARPAGLLRASTLLLVAHPDDECMFFGPTVQHLRDWGAALQVVSLSTGAGTAADRQ